ncbi:hypothetical protein GQ457_07G015890 [Hibiscus cannabinus]
MGNTFDEATTHAGQRFSIIPYITPRLSPTGTPKIISTSVSPRDHSVVQSPQRSSASTSLRKPSYDGRTSLSSWYPSSQQSSGANSAPHGHSLPVWTPRIDGKEFLGRVRSHLSHEQFSAILAMSTSGHHLHGNIYILSRELMKYVVQQVVCPHLVQGDECSADLKFCQHVICVCVCVCATASGSEN